MYQRRVRRHLRSKQEQVTYRYTLRPSGADRVVVTLVTEEMLGQLTTGVT